MSTARWGQKWADVDEDEEDGVVQGNAKQSTRFETKADKDGIKTVIEYIERDGHTYRVTKKVKQTTVTKWTNHNMVGRKTMTKFAKAATATEMDMKTQCVRSVEEINVEFCKKTVVNLGTKDDAEEKFFEESIKITESLLKEKKVWSEMNKGMHVDAVGVGEEKKEENATDVPAAPALASGAAGRYVPPSLRGGGTGDGKGGGKGKDGKGSDGQVEASLRVFNLSEDVKEGDLQDLFGQCGRLQRVYLAKDMTTFLSKGFAFITFYNKEDAQKAVDRLNGHGYDNLIMKVEWAKPRD